MSGSRGQGRKGPIEEKTMVGYSTRTVRRGGWLTEEEDRGRKGSGRHSRSGGGYWIWMRVETRRERTGTAPRWSQSAFNACQGSVHRMSWHTRCTPNGQIMSGRQGVQRVMPRKRETSMVLAEVTTCSKDTKEQQGVWSLLWLTRLEIKAYL